MVARCLMDRRIAQDERSFAELRVWELPEPVRGSGHRFKYRLAFVVSGACVLRFDNEAGKGDHWHLGGQETPYAFTNIPALLADFWQAIDTWRATHGDCDDRAEHP